MSHPASGDMAISRRHLQRLTLGIGATLAVAGFALLAVIAFMGWSADRHEIAAERARIDNALTQSVARVLDQQKSVAWWDDAVVNIMQKYDEEFVNTQFGIYLSETYGHDEIYILDAGDRSVYAYLNGARADSSAFGRRAALLQPVIDQARGLYDGRLAFRPDFFAGRQQHYRLLKGVLEPARWKGAILLIDGKPAIATAITIGPNVDMSIMTGRPFLLVSIVRITDAFVNDLNRSLLIPNLHLDTADASGGAAVSQPFFTDDGGRADFLTWTTSRPGRPLLAVILPLVAVGVIGMGLMSAKMLRRLTSASAELAAREAAARHDATHDALSGLPNRLSFVERATQALNGGQAEPQIVVGYLDIDRFKDINDTLGHHTGDELIIQLGRRLKEQLGPNTFIARFGGDEFAIFRQLAHHGDGRALGHEVARAFAEPLAVHGHDIRITASLGLAQSPFHGTATEELMRNADIALYVAKKQGRDQAVAFSGEMADELKQHREIEVDLREAIRNGELDLFFQPIVSSGTGRVKAVEALLRWKHPVKGYVSPALFIPIAEESGLMLELGEWVLRRAMESAALWPSLEVAINISPAQFRHADLPALLKTLLAETTVEAGRITLEITEGLLLDQSRNTHSTLEMIRAMGFRIALDDFGTGFSSLKYLIDFRFDKLKIDRSFVSGLNQAGSAQTIVRSVVQLGRALGMDVVAEGVETRFEAVVMQALGCDSMQGFLFSKPLPLSEVESFALSAGAADAPNVLAPHPAREQPEEVGLAEWKVALHS